MLNTIFASTFLGLTMFNSSVFAGEKRPSIPFEPLKIYLRNQLGNGKDHVIFNITSEAEWKKLEKDLIEGDHLPLKIDFKKYQVFGIQEFVSSGGHAISVESIESYSNKGKIKSFVAKIKSTKPGENCLTTTAMDAPHAFVLIPAKFKFRYAEFIVERFPDCSPK